MHLHVLAVEVIQLLKVVLQIHHVHLSGFRQTIELKTKRFHRRHVLGSPLGCGHAGDEPLGELLDGCVHRLLTLDELEFQLHLLHRRINGEPLPHRHAHLAETLKLSEHIILLTHHVIVRHPSRSRRCHIRLGVQVRHTTHVRRACLLNGWHKTRTLRRRRRGFTATNIVKIKRGKLDRLEVGHASHHFGIHEEVRLHLLLLSVCL